MKTIPIPQHNTICFGAVRYEHTWLCYANLTKFEQKFRFGHKFGVVADSVESNGGRLCCDDLFSVFIHSFAFAGQYLHVRKTRCVPFNDVKPCTHHPVSLSYQFVLCEKSIFISNGIFVCIMIVEMCIWYWRRCRWMEIGLSIWRAALCFVCAEDDADMLPGTKPMRWHCKAHRRTQPTRLELIRWMSDGQRTLRKKPSCVLCAFFIPHWFVCIFRIFFVRDARVVGEIECVFHRRLHCFYIYGKCPSSKQQKLSQVFSHNLFDRSLYCEAKFIARLDVFFCFF